MNSEGVFSGRLHLTLSSVLFKKWLAKTMFWGSGKPAVLTVLIWMISVASLAGFWWWYWQ
ncbi:hypothetical protein [Acinetobacter sp. YH12211]|uniref:hypothetical protein n=1 Tax=Acinetobacter sp. YH12211 TaxID=2601147 RepID=UPI00211E257B|nr:hypothetical protein [Acinetobacter sp. YH12211]